MTPNHPALDGEPSPYPRTPTLGGPCEPCWNFFRHESGDLWCGVPENLPVPAFLSGGRWHFLAARPRLAVLPAGHVRHSLEGARLNGFYLFQGLGERPDGQPPFRADGCA